MRRILLWTLVVTAVLVVILVSLVVVRAGEVEPLPPPDPALAIELPGGESLPLAEVLERARRDELPPLARPQVEALVAADGAGATSAAAVTAGGDVGPFPLVDGVPLVPDDPVYALAETARREGRHEQALALYLSIPPDSEHYARARRLVAWNILARDMDRPEQAVRYANEALHAAPFDGNAWQDWARVYGRTLGLPVD